LRVPTSPSTKRISRGVAAAVVGRTRYGESMANISAGFRKLLEEPSFCQLATIMPDGSPQISQVWVDTDGRHVLINTRQHSQKIRNIERDPRVAVNIVDPSDQWRLGTVRGRVVEVTTESANAHIDKLAKKYRGLDEYAYKDPNDPRVIVRIEPDRINETGLDK
jgi:PPOX class probable F420-dependent enzyme